MSVLDELREAILATRIVCDGCGKPLRKVGEAHDGVWVEGDRFPDLCGMGVETTLIDPEDAAEAIDAFEAAHPVLVDLTCCRCERPLIPPDLWMCEDCVRESACAQGSL